MSYFVSVDKVFYTGESEEIFFRVLGSGFTLGYYWERFYDDKNIKFFNNMLSQADSDSAFIITGSELELFIKDANYIFENYFKEFDDMHAIPAIEFIIAINSLFKGVEDFSQYELTVA